ncbi:MAG: hypothetical protein ABIS47_06500 [Acidimicrobiales bacterium]
MSMRRRIGVTAAALTGMLAAAVVPAGPAGAFTAAPQAYGGYSAGAETYLNVAGALPGSLAESTVAFSNSVVNSQGPTPVTDELGRQVTGADPVHAAKALGAGLELSVVGQQIQLVNDAMAVAPPSSSAENSLLELPVSTLAFADALEGRAVANFNDAGALCILGADLANGRGEGANVQLLGDAAAGGDGFPNPTISLRDGDPATRDVVSTNSRERLAAQTLQNGTVVGNNLGVLSQVVQTVAPITIADPTGTVAIQVEVAGTYNLSAFAGGLPGTGYVTYNPAAGTAPVLTITIPPASPLNALTGLLGPLVTLLPGGTVDPVTGAIVIPLDTVTTLLQPVIDLLAQQGIVIGESPRALNGTGLPNQAADGTSASAAIDLVRIKPIGLLAPLAALVTDVRVGHMEVSAFAPVGGVVCPAIGVGKTTDRDPVQVGESFVYTITVTNPYDCVLTNVRVQDDITANNGITFTVGATNPAADSVAPLDGGGTRVVFNNIGDVAPRGSRQVQVQVTINTAARNGKVSDTATVTSSCATGGGNGDANIKLNLSGQVTLVAPNVGAVAATELPRTGRDDRLYLFLGLSFVIDLAGVEALRRQSHNRA